MKWWSRWTKFRAPSGQFLTLRYQPNTIVTSLKLDEILQAKMMMEERIRENKLNVPTSNNMNSTTATDTDETVKSKVKLKNIIQAKV